MAIGSSSTDSARHECIICLDDITEENKSEMVITSCHHTYHETCLTNWIEGEGLNRKQCPTCRKTPIPLARALGVENDEDEFHPYIESYLVRAIRTNQIEIVINALKLTPLSPEKSSHTQEGLDQEVREARAFGFGLTHRDPQNQRSGSLISMAARHGHKEMVLRMIEAGAYIDAPDDMGSTALIHASAGGHENLALSLIGFGADIHVRNKLGVPLAYYAAQSGAVRLLEKLNKRGVDVKATTHEGRGLMHAAAINGHVDMLVHLYIIGFDINSKATSTGVTPLHLAVINQHPAAVEQLLKLHADTSLASLNNNQTALHDAAFQGNLEICGLLLNYRADINARAKSGSTPLFMAAQRGDIDTVRFLLDHGADKKLKKYNIGYSFLPFSAADVAYRNGDMALYELLK